MTKILYITNQICGSGGLERVLSIKASYLADVLDYEVHILTLNQGNNPLFFEFSKKIMHHDITAIGNPFSYFKSYLFGIKKIIQEIKPEIILVCDDGFKAFFLPILLMKPCPMIYERHVSKNVESNEKDSPLKILTNKTKFVLMDLLSGTYDKFVVLTQENTLEWKNNNLEVIANPLTFYPNSTSNLKNKTVIAVGKHCYQKGYDRLLQSWKIVHKKNPDWTLKIFGTIATNENLLGLSQKLNIEQSIQFFAPEKNIEKQYQEASIFVLSSRYEGFGMVIIEAMACGLPCVSFECPCGPKDIINNNKDGFLIENGAIIEFANKVNLLIEDENLRFEMGKKARENVKRFQPEIVVKMWHELFKKLLS